MDGAEIAAAGFAALGNTYATVKAVMREGEWRISEVRLLTKSTGRVALSGAL